VSVAALAHPVRAGLRAPVVWGLAVGVAQASVYIGFAVADGRRTVLTVEIGVAGRCVVIAAPSLRGGE